MSRTTQKIKSDIKIARFYMEKYQDLLKDLETNGDDKNDHYLDFLIFYDEHCTRLYDLMEELEYRE